VSVPLVAGFDAGVISGERDAFLGFFDIVLAGATKAFAATVFPLSASVILAAFLSLLNAPFRSRAMVAVRRSTFAVRRNL